MGMKVLTDEPWPSKGADGETEIFPKLEMSSDKGRSGMEDIFSITAM